MPLDIHIKRVQADGQVEDLIHFKQVASVHAFFKQRGFTATPQRDINAIHMHLLRRELLHAIGDTDTNHALQAVYDELDAIIRTKLKKNDRLILVNSNHAQLTIVR